MVRDGVGVHAVDDKECVKDIYHPFVDESVRCFLTSAACSTHQTKNTCVVASEISNRTMKRYEWHTSDLITLESDLLPRK